MTYMHGSGARQHEICLRHSYITHLIEDGYDPLFVQLIWSPYLGVFAVSAAGVLCAFPALWTRYLDSVSAARLAQIPLSLLFLELIGYYVNAVQLHVYAADVLVRLGVDRDDFR